MANNREFTIGLQEFENNEKISVMSYQQEDVFTHAHAFFELAYVTGGSATHTLNGKTGIVRKGDYFIVDYGSKHSYTGSRNFDLINCLFLPEVIDETLSGCRSFDELLRVCLIRYYKQYFGMTPANKIFHDEDGKVFLLLKGMQEEYDEKKTGYTEIFRCRLLEILILTMRRIVDEDKVHSQRGKRQSTAVLQTIQYLESNYRDKAVLGNFCQEYHYSLQYISRRFKQETGLSVSDYLQKIRIEKSCELLAGSDLRIQEVAHEVGYEDVKFFNQLFRRLLHIPPGEYRKMTLANLT